MIMECIFSTKYTFLVNGCPSDVFMPKRGLRQGDLISPFSLFLAWNTYQDIGCGWHTEFVEVLS